MPDFVLSAHLRVIQFARQTHTLLTMKQAITNHIRFALEHTGGKVKGKSNGSELLEMNPTILSFRMKKLSVRSKESSPPFNFNYYLICLRFIQILDILNFGYPAKKFGQPIFFRFNQLKLKLANLRLPSLIRNFTESFPMFSSGTEDTILINAKSFILIYVIFNFLILQSAVSISRF